MSFVLELFKNLLVVECASVLAGPAVGMFFAELGARVIKIENPNTNGDVTRSWKLPSEKKDNDISAYFSCVNWGKQSITLDLLNEKDRQFFNKLISKADVFIQNFKPGDEIKLKLSYEELKKLNEKLIYAKIDAFGEDDPRPGFDAILQAETGYMSINGNPGDDPLKMPVALIDVLLAHQIKQAILLALLQRTQTGEGSFISGSLFDAGVSSLVNQAANYLVAGEVPDKKGSEHPNISPYGSVYITKDNKQIVLAIGTDKQFKKFCKAIDLEYVAADPKFITNHQRVINRKELNKVLSKQIELFESITLLEIFKKQSIPAGLVRDIKEVLEKKNVKNILLQDDITNQSAVKSFIPKSSFLKSNINLTAPPKLGEHNKVIADEFN